MPKVYGWITSFREGNARERTRLRGELSKMNGALQVLMKPRNGQRWSANERKELHKLLRSASSVSPYLVVLALPGSILILPLLAWSLDIRRNRRPQEVTPGV